MNIDMLERTMKTSLDVYISVYYLIKAYKVHLELTNSVEQELLYKTGKIIFIIIIK